MDLLHWLCFGVLPALAAVLLFVGVGGPRCLALALSVAVCVPFGMAHGWPAWPWQLDLRQEPRAWLWWCLCAAGIVGSVYDLRLLPKPLALLGEACLVLSLPWLLSVELRAGWTFERTVVWLSIAWAAIAALWWVLRSTGKALPGIVVPLVGAIALTTDSLLMKSTGGGLGWQLAGVAAVALGVTVATTLWRRPFHCGTGAALSITVVHVGLLWCRRDEHELARAPFALALSVPLPLWLATTKAFAESRTTGAVVGVAGALGVAALVVLS
jgi:hypothetical protein